VLSTPRALQELTPHAPLRRELIFSQSLRRAMLKLTSLRELDLSTATHEDRKLHLSAASGLVRVGDRFYVVADDENHLGVFSAHDHAAPGELLRVLPGDLPDGKKKRKAAKADFEAYWSRSRRLPHSHTVRCSR
jgi:hypothetical protein